MLVKYTNVLRLGTSFFFSSNFRAVFKTFIIGTRVNRPDPERHTHGRRATPKQCFLKVPARHSETRRPGVGGTLENCHCDIRQNVLRNV